MGLKYTDTQPDTPDEGYFLIHETDQILEPFARVFFYVSEGAGGKEKARKRAERIVKACNAHDKLLAACKELLVDAKESIEDLGGCDHDANICVCVLKSEIEDAEAAITLAEKGV